MKFSECDVRQKKAWKNIKWAASDYIFGLMNGCFDSERDSEEWKDYFEGLNDLEGLIDMVYREATTTIHDEGICAFGKEAESWIKDIRFCGKEFLMKIVKKYCTLYQKEALEQVI